MTKVIQGRSKGMLWFLYNLLFPLFYALLLPKFILRMARRGGYRRHFLERFGIYGSETARRLGERRRIWIHAVSVGETYVASSLMKEMRKRDPETAFVLTTTTSTGRRIAEKEVEKEDVVVYFPSDFPFAVKRALNRMRPLALLLAESELWPNLVRLAGLRGLPVVLFNGRISKSSYEGYRLGRVFFREMLNSVNLFLVQSHTDKKRLVMLGADQSNVEIMGSAKYDVVEDDRRARKSAEEMLIRAGFDLGEPILTGGSTWPGEEDILANIYRKIKEKGGKLRLVLVPRHAERRAEVEAVLKRHGLPCLRRSEIGKDFRAGDGDPVLLVDTTGELKSLYACASIIFVGKSLTQHGGQNIIEPAMYGKPVIVGPNMENFPDVMADFRAGEAVLEVHDAGELYEEVARLLDDPEARAFYGRNAALVVREKKGVVAASVDRIIKLIGSSSDEDVSGEPGR